MASWRNSCSSTPHRPATKRPSRSSNRPSPEPRATGAGRVAVASLLAVFGAGCGHAADPAPAAAAQLDPAQALCRPSTEGFLRARLQGSVDAEIDWAAPGVQQCLGGPRPAGDGVRLVYKGKGGDESLLVIVGIALARNQTDARNVPASVTVVREGTGAFYATQGDDKCALDEVRQEPLPGSDGRYRLSGRGYCVQPARAIGDGAGVVLVSRFDVIAIVEYPAEP